MEIKRRAPSIYPLLPWMQAGVPAEGPWSPWPWCPPSPPPSLLAMLPSGPLHGALRAPLMPQLFLVRAFPGTGPGGADARR